MLILDEAASAFTEAGVTWLTELLRRLASQGTVVVFISHRMAEVRAVCDRATILRNGSTVGTWELGASETMCSSSR